MFSPRVVQNRWFKIVCIVALPIILLLPLRNISEDRRRTFNHGSGGVYCVAFSPDGSTLVSTGHATKLWNVKTRELLQTLKETTFSVVFSPDGKTLTGIVYDTGTQLEARIWNAQSGKGQVSWTIPGTHVAAAEQVALSPDSTMIAVVAFVKADGKRDQQIKVDLRDVNTGTLLRRLSGAPDGQVAAFSPNSRILALGGNTLAVWEVQTGKLLQSLGTGSGTSLNTCSVAFSPDGKILASGGAGEQSEVRLWDVATGQLMHTLVGHTGPIKALAFSPDGRMLASGAAWNRFEVLLWDVKSGALQHTLNAHKGRIKSLAFSSGGSTLASGSEDGTVKLWRIK